MSTPHPPGPRSRYGWARAGDVNAFFGLMLDNVAVLIILFTLTTTAGRFTPEFVLTHMIPGTAVGVLLGDLVYTWMAFRLARRTGRSDVTAMPLGLDTPSTIGVALLVLNPVLNEALRRPGISHEAAMTHAWHVGAVVLVLIGVFKSLVAPLGNAVRRWVPRAGLLGSLAAIALAMIAFWPLATEVAAAPLVGLPALAVILVTLVAHRALPGKIPGALAAVVVGVVLYHLCLRLGPVVGLQLVPEHPPVSNIVWQPPNLLPALGWAAAWPAALALLPIVLPFALATIVGGIDCTESAAAVGDEYDTRTVLLTEGLASVVAGLCGGVIQNTPYIGHPAYKAMGGRAAYTLATAIFIGAAGYFGWFTHLFDWLPRAAMFPILIYVGLEITAQSFRATPARHYPALALAALPALAYLILIPLGMVRRPELDPPAALVVQTLTSLANGFILTSLLWGAALAALIDGGYRRAAAYLAVAGALALFGVIHSPLQPSEIDLPGRVMARLARVAGRPALGASTVGLAGAPLGQGPLQTVAALFPGRTGMEPSAAEAAALLHTPYHWAGTYALIAVFFVVLGCFGAGKGREDEPAAGPAAPEPLDADAPTERLIITPPPAESGHRGLSG